MTRKFLICRQHRINCPFRSFDAQSELLICDFYKEYWRIYNDGNTFGAKTLLNRACEWINKEEKRLDFICNLAKKSFLDLIQNVQVGDTVFCRIAPYHKIKLLKMPLDDSEYISCEAPNGRVIRVQAHHLRMVSKGSYNGVFFTSDIDESIQDLEYKINSYGFRTEIKRKENGYLLKVYGDSQQEVDEFIALVLEQDFDISPYI